MDDLTPEGRRIYEVIKDIMSSTTVPEESAPRWDQGDVYPPLAELRRALMTDVEWAAMSDWDKDLWEMKHLPEKERLNSIEGIVEWLPEAQRDQRRTELLEEILRFGEPAPMLNSSSAPASATSDISTVLRVPTEPDVVHDAVDNQAASMPTTCLTDCPSRNLTSSTTSTTTGSSVSEHCCFDLEPATDAPGDVATSTRAPTVAPVDSTLVTIPAVTAVNDTMDVHRVTPSTCSMLGLDDNSGEEDLVDVSLTMGGMLASFVPSQVFEAMAPHRCLIKCSVEDTYMLMPKINRALLPWPSFKCSEFWTSLLRQVNSEPREHFYCFVALHIRATSLQLFGGDQRLCPPWPSPELVIMDCHTEEVAGCWAHSLELVKRLLLHSLDNLLSCPGSIYVHDMSSPCVKFLDDVLWNLLKCWPDTPSVQPTNAILNVFSWPWSTIKYGEVQSSSWQLISLGCLLQYGPEATVLLLLSYGRPIPHLQWSRGLICAAQGYFSSHGFLSILNGEAEVQQRFTCTRVLPVAACKEQISHYILQGSSRYSKLMHWSFSHSLIRSEFLFYSPRYILLFCYAIVAWKFAWIISLVSQNYWFQCCRDGRESLYSCENFQWTIAWPTTTLSHSTPSGMHLYCTFECSAVTCYLELEITSLPVHSIFLLHLHWDPGGFTQRRLRVMPKIREIALLCVGSYWVSSQFARNGTVTTRELSLWRYPMLLVNQMVLKMYNSFYAEDLIDVGLLITVLMQDWFLPCFNRKINQCGSADNQWKITRSLNVQLFYSGNKFSQLSCRNTLQMSLLVDWFRCYPTISADCRFLTSSKISTETFWLLVYVAIWNSCSMKFGCEELSWDPGILAFPYSCDFFAQAAAQGGINEYYYLVYLTLHLPWDPGDCSASAWRHDKPETVEDACYLPGTDTSQVPWDPGGSSRDRLGGKPNFMGEECQRPFYSMLGLDSGLSLLGLGLLGN